MSHMTVTLVGDSFFKRLQQHLLQQQPEQSNFDFHSHMVAIAWMAEGGLTLTKLYAYLHSQPHLSGIMHSMILHIGSNDLCTVSVEVYIDHLVHYIVPRLLDLGYKHITVCEILHRHRGFYTDHMNLSEYNAKVDAANAALRQLATTSDSDIIDFWEHRDLKQSGRIHSMWHGDGVHLRRNDQIYLKRSVRGAILRQINLRRYVNYLYNNVISYNIVWPPALPCPRLSPTRPQPCRSRDNVPGGHVSSPPPPPPPTPPSLFLKLPHSSPIVQETMRQGAMFHQFTVPNICQWCILCPFCQCCSW